MHVRVGACARVCMCGVCVRTQHQRQLQQPEQRNSNRSSHSAATAGVGGGGKGAGPSRRTATPAVCVARKASCSRPVVHLGLVVKIGASVRRARPLAPFSLLFSEKERARAPWRCTATPGLGVTGMRSPAPLVTAGGLDSPLVEEGGRGEALAAFAAFRCISLRRQQTRRSGCVWLHRHCAAIIKGQTRRSSSGIYRLGTSRLIGRPFRVNR